MVCMEEEDAMAKKGLNIYKRKDGRWEGRILLDSGEGKRRYYSVYGHSYREAKEKLLEAAAKSPKEERKCALTVSQVMEQWLKDKQNLWKESTYACYRQLVNRYVTGRTGQMRAANFNNIQFHLFLQGIRCKSGSEASSAYLHNIGAAVIQAFRYMQREYHYELPVLTNVKTVRTGRNLVLPSDIQMHKLRDYLYQHKEDNTCIGILLAYHTGIRLGELCALKWEDIDFEKGILQVSRNLQRVTNFDDAAEKTDIRIQTPKTATSVRSIPLPDRLTALLLQNRREGNGYIIRGKKREWAEARTVQYRFRAILKECGIEPFKFHMLRHYFATTCIQHGFDVKSLSEILGHATVQTTLNLYVHSSMSRKRTLMNHIFEEAV